MKKLLLYVIRMSTLTAFFVSIVVPSLPSSFAQHNISSVLLVLDNGTPITTAQDIRISLWSDGRVESGDITGGGAINGSAPNYAGYQTVVTMTPDSAGRVKIAFGSLSSFPELTPENQFMMIEYKEDADPDTAYVIYDETYLGSAMDRFPLLIGGSDIYQGIYTNHSTTSDHFTLDHDDDATDVTLQFGKTLNESLKWNDGQNYFELSDALVVGGNLNVTDTIIRIDSDNSGAGADVTIVAEQGSDADGVLRYNATTNQWEISNNGGLFQAISTGAGGGGGSGDDDFESVYDNDADKILNTSNGAYTINTGNNDFIVDSNDWNVNSNGDLDVKGLSTSGATNFSSATSIRIRESANPTTSAACTTLNEIIMNTTFNRIEVCMATGIAGSATWTALPVGDASTLGGLSSSQFLRSDTSDNYTSGILTFDAGTTFAVNGTSNFNGVVSLGDGGDDININSNDWDISSAGVASGFTGITSTGAIDYTGATYQGPQGAVDPATCTVGQEFYNTSSNVKKICTASNTWSPQFRTDTSQSFTSGTLTFNSGTTLTANGAVNFSAASSFRLPQGAADPGTCSVGQEFFNTTSNSLKLCTATNTWTIVGSANGSDLLDGVDSTQFLRSDASDNFTSGTLTTDNGTTLNVNGVANIGDGGDNIAVNSNSWDVSSAGVASGLTGLTSTGTVNLSGTGSMRIREVNDEATATCTTVNEIVLDITEDKIYICTAAGSPGTWAGIGAGNTDALDTLDSTQFLRSDSSSNLTSGTLTTDNGTTLAVNGTASLGDGGDDIAINSNDWDISSAGVGSGFTGFASSGAISFSTATSFLPPQGSSDPANCTVGQLFYNTTSNTFRACTATNTWSAIGGSSDFETVYTTDADKVLTTSNGAFTVATGTNDFIVDSNDWNVTAAGALDAASITSNGALTATGTTNLNGTANLNGVTTIGDNGDTVDVNSSDWDISTTGNMTGIGTINADGLITGTAGATLSGATTSINDSSNFATNIGTGTSTGQVSLGGNSNCVAVDSNTWNVSCAGIFSGLTGLTSTGTINFSGATIFRMSELSSDPGTCTPGQQYYNTTTNTVRICVGTNTWTSAGAAGTQYVFAYDTTTQTVAAANTFQGVNFSNNGLINGWTHTPGTSVFTAQVGGTYMGNLTGRVARTGGTNTTASFRAVINGTEVSGSQSYGGVAGNTGDTISGNFIFTVNAGDQVVIQMTGGTTNVQILPGGAGTVLPSAQFSIWRLN